MAFPVSKGLDGAWGPFGRGLLQEAEPPASSPGHRLEEREALLPLLGVFRVPAAPGPAAPPPRPGSSCHSVTPAATVKHPGPHLLTAGTTLHHSRSARPMQRGRKGGLSSHGWTVMAQHPLRVLRLGSPLGGARCWSPCLWERPTAARSRPCHTSNPRRPLSTVPQLSGPGTPDPQATGFGVTCHSATDREHAQPPDYPGAEACSGLAPGTMSTCGGQTVSWGDLSCTLARAGSSCWSCKGAPGGQLQGMAAHGASPELQGHRGIHLGPPTTNGVWPRKDTSKPWCRDPMKVASFGEGALAEWSPEVTGYAEALKGSHLCS